MRGALTKIGDTVDRFMGRKWTPSSSLATSELIERIKKLLDAQAKQIAGKGSVVPHNIKLKVQWDKFSIDSEEAIKQLEDELLVATVDHINDSLYYTYAPITLDVKPDYFIEGVKLLTSFDQFVEESSNVEMNVTVAGVNLRETVAQLDKRPRQTAKVIARYTVNGINYERPFEMVIGESISVGRAGTNALVIEEQSLSKIHASLSIDTEGTLSVADTGSTNGTFINGQRISYAKATRLVAGDKLKFGTVEIEFEIVERPLNISESDDDIATSKTVEIDGFEFTSRLATESNVVIEKKDATVLSTEADSTSTAEDGDEAAAIEDADAATVPVTRSAIKIEAEDDK